MERAVFVLIGVTVAVGTIVLSFGALTVSSKVFRLPDTRLSRALKVGVILMVVGVWGRLVAEGLTAAGNSKTAVSVVSGSVLIIADVMIVMRMYRTSMLRAVGVLVFVSGIGILWAVAVRGFLFQGFLIPSESMEPTLRRGDQILVAKYAYRLTEPKRGDVIAFAIPSDPGLKYVKRVIGLPGDEVQIRNKVVWINGKPLHDPWGHVEDLSVRKGSTRDNYGPVHVAPGAYFVLGDNRDLSFDSRFWGGLPTANIEGKVMLRYWPWSWTGALP